MKQSELNYLAIHLRNTCKLDSSTHITTEYHANDSTLVIALQTPNKKPVKIKYSLDPAKSLANQINSIVEAVNKKKKTPAKKTKTAKKTEDT